MSLRGGGFIAIRRAAGAKAILRARRPSSKESCRRAACAPQRDDFSLSQSRHCEPWGVERHPSFDAPWLLAMTMPGERIML